MGAEEGFNRRRIRVGLAIVGVVTLVALVLALVISSPVGRAIMVAVAATGFIRMVLLTRSSRRGR